MKKPYETLDKVFDIFPELYGNCDGQKDRYEKLFSDFKRDFGVNAGYFVSSPGRVEICGNHVDHNGGSVISAAIDKDTLAVFMPNDSTVIKIKSEGYDDILIDSDKDEKVKKGTSAALVKGVCIALKNMGFKVGGFNALVCSDVLGGAGISSSASFEVLIAEIINFLFNDGKITEKDKAIAAQYAEKEIFGKPCGLLDQTAIAYGGLNLLDFSVKGEIKVSKARDGLKDYSLVLINTGGSHENLTDEYASIPVEMRSVAAFFGKDRLIEVKEKDFYGKIKELSERVSDRAILRAIHFYSENKRVISAFDDLSGGNYGGFISAINESGLSSLAFLQNCYVSGSKDQPIVKAVALSKKYNVNGATRVHGGGFAGTVLNIISKKKTQAFIDNMRVFYDEKDVIMLNVRNSGTKVL